MSHCQDANASKVIIYTYILLKYYNLSDNFFFIHVVEEKEEEEEGDVDIETVQEEEEDLATVKEEEVEIKIEVESEDEELMKHEEIDVDESEEEKIDEDVYNEILVTLTPEEIEQVCRESIEYYYSWGNGYYPSEEPLEHIVRRYVIKLRKNP